MAEIVIRRAVMADLDALLDIYNHYVRETHITFDVEPRNREQRKVWLEAFAPVGRRQCFVAERGTIVLGWASSGPFKDRAAYDTSVETSVYLAPGEGGQGLGRMLYTSLFTALAKEDVHRAFGGIALPNDASIALHLAMGFRHVGTFGEVGRKFGRYWDVAWYEKSLAQSASGTG
jgi:phosphinothricin acetyltransferase